MQLMWQRLLQTGNSKAGRHHCRVLCKSNDVISPNFVMKKRERAVRIRKVILVLLNSTTGLVSLLPAH